MGQKYLQYTIQNITNIRKYRIHQANQSPNDIIQGPKLSIIILNHQYSEFIRQINFQMISFKVQNCQSSSSIIQPLRSDQQTAGAPRAGSPSPPSNFGWRSGSGGWHSRAVGNLKYNLEIQKLSPCRPVGKQKNHLEFEKQSLKNKALNCTGCRI